MAIDKKKKGYSKQAMLKRMAGGPKGSGHYSKYGDYDPRDVLTETEFAGKTTPAPPGKKGASPTPSTKVVISQYDKGMTATKWAEVLADNHPDFAKDPSKISGKPFLFQGKLHKVTTTPGRKGGSITYGSDVPKV